MGAIFGPAGSSKSFNNFKGVDLSKYLESFGLKAYEYQCGMGVRISEQKAEYYGKLLKNFAISIHAPYYISLSSISEIKRNNSVSYIRETAQVAKLMGAKRVVVHSGSCAKISREQALDYSIKTMKRALLELKENGLDEIFVCPETMGKVNQLGNLDEVISICKISENLVPCIDFGHLNARSFGGIKSKEDYLEILNKIENNLGYDRLKNFHAHFSKVEYTIPGGEKRHLTFEDKIYGPNFELLAEIIAKKGLSPIFICESAGTQAEDASFMKKIYENFLV